MAISSSTSLGSLLLLCIERSSLSVSFVLVCRRIATTAVGDVENELRQCLDPEPGGAVVLGAPHGSRHVDMRPHSRRRRRRRRRRGHGCCNWRGLATATAGDAGGTIAAAAADELLQEERGGDGSTTLTAAHILAANINTAIDHQHHRQHTT